MQLVRGSKRGRIAFALEIALAIAIFTATAMLGAHFQKPIGVDGWLGWDGPTYYSVAEQLSMVGRAHGDPPFVHRIGTALIAIAYAKLTHAPLATAFRSVNLGANVVLLGALVWLLRTYVGSLTVRVLALAAMVTHWASPFRMLYYMLSVDHVAQALVVLGVIAIHHARARETPLRVGAVILLSMMGAVTREITIEALPGSIPEHIEVDLGELEIGGTVRLESIVAIEGVTFLDDPHETVIASCSAPRGLEEEEAAAEEEGELAEGEVAAEAPAADGPAGSDDTDSEG